MIFCAAAASFLILKNGAVGKTPMTGENLVLNNKAVADPINEEDWNAARRQDRRRRSIDGRIARAAMMLTAPDHLDGTQIIARRNSRQ
jgi:hypothetical protein